jgi:hypothetical protein
MGADGKTAIIDLGEATGPRAFNITRLKPAHMPNTVHSDTSLHSFYVPVFVTEVINSSDPRSENFGLAMQEEMMNLIERGTFKIVLKPDLTLEESPNTFYRHDSSLPLRSETQERKF